MLFLVICHQEKVRIQTTTVQGEVAINNRYYLVAPDNITVKDDMLVAQVKDLQTKEQLKISYYPKDKKELQSFKRLTKNTIWRVSGKIYPDSPPTNFNQFDSQQYYWQLHIYNRLKAKEIKNEGSAQHGNILDCCHSIRARLSHYYQTLPQPISGYCQQLTIGMKSDQNQELMESVKKLGLLHLFCISGMHVFLIIEIGQRLLIYCHFNRDDISWILICLLPFYLIIGGGSVSLVRAIIMAELGLIQKISRLSSLDGWSISLIGGLLIDPWLLLSLGGQLSYLLAFALQVLPDAFGNFKQSFILNLISLPSLLYFIYEIHLLSFISSFVVIPIFSAIIFPAVLLCAICYPFLPGLVSFINQGLRLFDVILSKLSELPGMITFGKPNIICALALLIITLILVERFNYRALLILFTLYFGVFISIHIPYFGEVNFVDIGQGDSMIIRYPLTNKVELIDTGGKVTFFGKEHPVDQRYDLANSTSVPYLKSCGVRKISAVYLSHHDIDHIGYLPDILRNFEVERIMVPSGMEKQKAFLRLFPDDAVNSPQIVPVTTQSQLKETKLRVLHPFKPVQGNNEDSMALQGKFGGKTFMFMGDLDQAGEKAIIKKYNLRCDVLKLGHHGSKTSSAPQFIAKLSPQIGIISAGRKNRYGHPNQETLVTLKRYNVRAVSTQKYGMIRYKYFGNHGEWETKLKGDEFSWMLQP